MTLFDCNQCEKEFEGAAAIIWTEYSGSFSQIKREFVVCSIECEMELKAFQAADAAYGEEI